MAPSSHVQLIDVMFLAFFVPAFSLYHLMIFRVNRQLPPQDRISHFLYWSEWNRLKKLYKALYPKNIVYPFTFACAVTVLILAVTLLCIRFWGYLSV